MPIAGAPRTASVRIASATSAAERHSSSTSASGSLRWSRITTRSPSSRTTSSGVSSRLTPVPSLTPTHPRGAERYRHAADAGVPNLRRKRTRPGSLRLRPFLPRGEVALLLLGQLVDLQPHRRELEARDLAVDLLGHRI